MKISQLKLNRTTVLYYKNLPKLKNIIQKLIIKIKLLKLIKINKHLKKKKKARFLHN